MGNQRTVRQTEPFRCRGAALRVRPGAGPVVDAWLDAHDRFYTHFCAAGEEVAFPNLDAEPTSLGRLPGEYVVVQSGGKMWCGYDAFVDNLRHLAPHLEDARFFVGDEQTRIDEVRVHASRLLVRCVYEGSWCPLDDFLRDHPPG